MSDNDSKSPSLGRSREEFFSLFNKSAEFLKDMMDENERLRFRVAQLENAGPSAAAPLPDDATVEQLRRRIDELERERGDLLGRYRQVEEENKDFARRYVDVEMQNNNLANLYIASYQLHSTLNSGEVLEIVMEIIINLIGAEVFGVLLIDEKTNEIVPVKLEGADPADFQPVKIGTGVIGRIAQSGQEYFCEDVKNYTFEDYEHPMVGIPLKIKERVIGVISIYKLLQQKERFEDVDYELFTLLAGHAATAIFASKLYSQAERKLTTMQGFIDLITK